MIISCRVFQGVEATAQVAHFLGDPHSQGLDLADPHGRVAGVERRGDPVGDGAPGAAQPGDHDGTTAGSARRSTGDMAPT